MTVDAVNDLWRRLTTGTEKQQASTRDELAQLFARLTDGQDGEALLLLSLLDEKMRECSSGIGESIRVRNIVMSAVLAVFQVRSFRTDHPAVIHYVVRYSLDEPDRLNLVMRLWAGLLRHRPHRRDAIRALHSSQLSLNELSNRHGGGDARLVRAALARALSGDELKELTRDYATVNQQSDLGLLDLSMGGPANTGANLAVATRVGRTVVQYPITARRHLAKAEKSKWYRRAERSDADLLQADAHHVLVYRVGGDYVLDND
ncbi:hypothetical protein OWR29_00005, partial [Actinoplanes sp. Pm04-4]